jgi:hypothetical protein
MCPHATWARRALNSHMYELTYTSISVSSCDLGYKSVQLRPHTTICVSSYYYIPHTTISVSSYYYRSMCAHATWATRALNSASAAASHDPSCTIQQAYVSMRQHTSAYGSIRQHTSTYVSIRQRIRQHTSAYVSIRQYTSAHTAAYVSIRQHTAAYVSIRQHPAAYVSIREHTQPRQARALLEQTEQDTAISTHTVLVKALCVA